MTEGKARHPSEYLAMRTGRSFWHIFMRDSARSRCGPGGCSDFRPRSRSMRRLLAMALVLEGTSRADAARQTGMDRQTLRDWVHRFNESGAGPRDRDTGSPGLRRQLPGRRAVPRPGPAHDTSPRVSSGPRRPSSPVSVNLSRLPDALRNAVKQAAGRYGPRTATYQSLR